jgi:tRNA/tmRNA/rRNA uracil-C5-methylase (TrmA/RlmC/RlmD family)
LELQVGPVAHGGHCVARHEGRVLFVRHALPGEIVLAQVTEDRGGSFCRADAVEVRQASPDRVEPPCRYARPGGCGGCDFQHVDPAAQRVLKAAVVAEQLSRLAGLDLAVTVQPLAGESLGWRRRIRFAVGAGGRLGLHKHRSAEVLPIDRCLLGAPGVGDSAALDESWDAGLSAVELAVDDGGAVAAVGFRPSGGPQRGRARPQPRPELLSGPAELHYEVAGHRFAVPAAGFWQTHPRAADTFTGRVLAAAALQPGERALDLYAGAGLFTAVLAEAVGPTGRVHAVEGDRVAARSAQANLAGLDQAAVEHAAVSGDAVDRIMAELAPDVVVLDPPRTGAGAAVIQAVLAGGPRTVVYVACDPAALARDIRTAAEQGWRLATLEAFDAYPMTHHIECVAVLEPAEQPAGPDAAAG